MKEERRGPGGDKRRRGQDRTRLVGGENEFEKDKLAMFVFWGFMRDENLGELIIL